MALCTQNRCADQTALHLAHGVDEPNSKTKKDLRVVFMTYYYTSCSSIKPLAYEEGAFPNHYPFLSYDPGLSLI